MKASRELIALSLARPENHVLGMAHVLFDGLEPQEHQSSDLRQHAQGSE
jgi:hypothetical protein